MSRDMDDFRRRSMGLEPVDPNPALEENLRRGLMEINSLVVWALQTYEGRMVTDTEGNSLRVHDATDGAIQDYPPARVPRVPIFARHPLVVRGVIQSGFGETDASVELGSLVNMIPAYVDWPEDVTTINVINRYGHVGGAGEPLLAILNQETWQWETLDGGRKGSIHSAKVQSDWVNQTGQTMREVHVRTCDSDGGGDTGDTYSIYTPLCTNALTSPTRPLLTAFWPGDVVYWSENSDGVKVVTGPVVFDGALGDIKLWHGSYATIPRGWAAMDGTHNAGALGGSGIDMRAMFARGNSATTACDDTEYGEDTHTHTEEEADGEHTHTGTTDSGGTHTPSGSASISIASSGAHAHDISINDHVFVILDHGVSSTTAEPSSGENTVRTCYPQDEAGNYVHDVTISANGSVSRTGGNTGAQVTLTHSDTWPETPDGAHTHSGTVSVTFNEVSGHTHTFTTGTGDTSHAHEIDAADNIPKHKLLHFIERIGDALGGW